MQVSFVTVLVVSALLRLDKVTFRGYKLFLNFVAVTSFQFVAFAFSVAVGLDKIRKPLPFSVAAGSYFFQLLLFI
jgi:hypothetical protein